MRVVFTPSSDDASVPFDILARDAAPGCYAEAIGNLMTEQLAAGGGPGDAEFGELTFNPVSFPNLGDDSLAFRVSVPVSSGGLDVDVYADLVIVRSGRIGITASFVSALSPFDVDEAARLAQVVVDRAGGEG